MGREMLTDVTAGWLRKERVLSARLSVQIQSDAFATERSLNTGGSYQANFAVDKKTTAGL